MQIYGQVTVVLNPNHLFICESLNDLIASWTCVQQVCGLVMGELSKIRLSHAIECNPWLAFFTSITWQS